jgi:signal transduction histidine kinase
VADQGYGIPQSELPRIFERFYRVDKARSRNAGGTGLGLAIARHAVESLGGTLSVRSQPGSGSTFEIRFFRPHPDGAPSDDHS